MSKTKRIYNILVINPGSTSTKLALFANQTAKYRENIPHPTEELTKFATVIDQGPYRLALLRQFLTGNQITQLDAIAARGGMLHPLVSGVYRVNDLMLADLKVQRFGEHACNLGAILAQALANEYNCPAYIADPPIVDELEPVARLSGMPGVVRKSQFHALNQKYVAHLIANRLHKKYEQCNFIIAHLGGGISVGAHHKGRVIDVNNALDGDGPFSPERSGGVPIGDLVRMIEQAPRCIPELKKKIVGRGGVTAYCGTNNMEELKNRIDAGDAQAGLVYEALLYQVSKEIAMHGATLEGKVTAIILTGGLCNDPDIIKKIKKRINYLGPVFVVPGEREMEALAWYTLEVLQGKRRLAEYTALASPL